MKELTTQDTQRRFSGLDRLYGPIGFQRIQNAHVTVIGVGGVGSWAVEALARSGIGRMTLIDLDHVSESNVNRQLQALSSTLGLSKVVALKQRIAEINDECRVDCIEEFVDTQNAAELLPGQTDYVLDCIDASQVKAALIAYCTQQKLPIITVGAAGGKLDPSRITRADLAHTEQDALLSKTRRLLRKQYGFSKRLTKKFKIDAVYSKEAATVLEGCSIEANTGAALNCAGYGSVTHVTASFAFHATAEVLKQISQNTQKKKTESQIQPTVGQKLGPKDEKKPLQGYKNET